MDILQIYDIINSNPKELYDDKVVIGFDTSHMLINICSEEDFKIGTMAMYWIYKVGDKLPIPDKILHSPNVQALSTNYTCAMYWIEFLFSYPPMYIIHDPLIKNIYGQTCAMLFIYHNRYLPSKELLHDPTIYDNNGDTCAL